MGEQEPSSVASCLAGMVLEETLRNGGTVEIPSLGITIRRDYMAEQVPVSDLIEQAADKIERIYNGNLTLGTDLAGPLRHVLTGLVAAVLERKDQERDEMRALLEKYLRLDEEAASTPGNLFEWVRHGASDTWEAFAQEARTLLAKMTPGEGAE